MEAASVRAVSRAAWFWASQDCSQLEMVWISIASVFPEVKEPQQVTKMRYQWFEWPFIWDCLFHSFSPFGSQVAFHEPIYDICTWNAEEADLTSRFQPWTLALVGLHKSEGSPTLIRKNPAKNKIPLQKLRVLRTSGIYASENQVRRLMKLSSRWCP